MSAIDRASSGFQRVAVHTWHFAGTSWEDRVRVFFSAPFQNCFFRFLRDFFFPLFTERF
jgi:hypothetical protein